MDLYNFSLNINNVNKEELIKKSIEKVKNHLQNLTHERMCKIYTSYIYEELKNNGMTSRIINTTDLGLSYEHYFVLVLNNQEEKNYFLIDLTFDQFLKEGKTTYLEKIIDEGYQIINNDLLNIYLNKIEKTKNYYYLDQVYFGVIEEKVSEGKNYDK